MKPATAASHPTSQPHRNRLADAASPYLLQHADNPVDWYEWSPDALQKARAEDKPIFLSIGYAACHWCHVMAHESFENRETAAVMNRYFVNIKVDREERPDLDDIYMQATMLMNQGQGGWPMSVWLTPDLKPFFTGTYFPPEARWGRPGFRQICERVGELWASRSDRPQLIAQSEEIARAVRESLSVAASSSAPADKLTTAFIDKVAEQLANHFDPVHGGVSGGGTNKFPPSMALDLLLRSASRRPADDATRSKLEKMARLTLDKMAAGGIYDHLAGGIARYSTDEEWLVPHFEKMLYDQALVSRIYVDGHQFFGITEYAQVARGIFDYVLADLRSPQGGFYSSRDADSEGEEGKYYVWTRAEIFSLLDSEMAEALCAYYGVVDKGNWSDPHAPGVPKNILHVVTDLDSLAKQFGVSRETLQVRIAAGRVKLLEARKRRVPPGLDDKVLAEWNGLMISALARGGAVLNEPKYIQAAAAAADFILTQQTTHGRLNRAWRDGRKLETAFMTDYAAMIDGLLELYEATFERRWLDSALKLNEQASDLFWDEDAGGYFFTSGDHEQLLVRNKDLRDGATPSGNSVQLLNLLRLHVMTGDAKLLAMAEQMISTFGGELLSAPAAYERFLAGVDCASGGRIELAIVGPAKEPATQALLRTIHATYLPNRVIMLLDPTSASASLPSPLMEGRKMLDGKPTVYVCRNYTCQKPVTTPDELKAQLPRGR